MIRHIAAATLALTASAAIAQPPLPPYQLRAAQQAGDRHAKTRDAKAAFEHTCGTCHLAGGMGSNLLTVQMLQQKRPPSDGLLTNRQDLYPDYVKAVVRHGKGAMPAQTRVDLTDAELDQVANYLAKGKK
jgi:mono/diheme cytochrome c family protein